MLVLSSAVADVAWAAALGMGTSQRQHSTGKQTCSSRNKCFQTTAAALMIILVIFAFLGLPFIQDGLWNGIGELCSINLLLILSPELCHSEPQRSDSAGTNAAGSLGHCELAVSVLIFWGDCGRCAWKARSSQDHYKLASCPFVTWGCTRKIQSFLWHGWLGGT